MIDRIKNVASQYRKQLGEISPDLKNEVQNQKKAEVHKALKSGVEALRVEADTLVRDFRQVRERNLDRRYLVATRATNGIKDLTLGESQLINMIDKLPPSLLPGLASDDKVTGYHPLVRLSLLNRAEGMTNPVDGVKVGGSAAYAEAVDGQKVGHAIVDSILKSESVNIDGLRSEAAKISETCLAMADLMDASQQSNRGYQKMYSKYAEEVINDTQDAIESFQNAFQPKQVG